MSMGINYPYSCHLRCHLILSPVVTRTFLFNLGMEFRFHCFCARRRGMLRSEHSASPSQHFKGK